MPAETPRDWDAATYDRVGTPQTRWGLEALESFLATVCLRAHLARLAPEERPGFVRAVADRLDRPEIDYVRLNIVARRAR